MHGSTFSQSPAARRAFIRSQTRRLAVPHVPEIRLRLAHEAVELWQKTEEELGAIGLPPPFWAFAWAGGQAVARYILDNRQQVAGRTVFDFAAGSGLVAIAACMAGAASVAACEVDPFAVEAMALNAAENTVAFDVVADDVLDRPPQQADIITAGDVFYEHALSDRVLRWLQAHHDAGATVLIGDPGRSYLPRDRLRKLAEYAVPVTRELEDADIKHTAVWTFA